MRFALARITWLIAGIGIFLMSLSINVQRISNEPFSVEQSEAGHSEDSRHWADFLLNVLEEAGEDLPGKNLQPRSIKAVFRKYQPDQSSNPDLPYKRTYAGKEPANSYKPLDEIIPEPGYYTSLSLLYVF
jgi:hypothetical protein